MARGREDRYIVAILVYSEQVSLSLYRERKVEGERESSVVACSIAKLYESC